MTGIQKDRHWVYVIGTKYEYGCSASIWHLTTAKPPTTETKKDGKGKERKKRKRRNMFVSPRAKKSIDQTRFGGKEKQSLFGRKCFAFYSEDFSFKSAAWRNSRIWQILAPSKYTVLRYRIIALVSLVHP